MCNHLAEEEGAGCFALAVFMLSCTCICSVSSSSVDSGWVVCSIEYPNMYLFIFLI